MKYYIAGKLLNRIENQEYELLFGVSILNQKRGCIKRNNWGTGWIYDSDESFCTWCAVAYGFQPVQITDQEFYLLLSDGVAFLSRERTLEINASLMTQVSLIAINS